MLAVAGLSVAFPAGTAVRGVSFTLAAGERLGIAGESGSGKSLLALSILGMAPPAARVQGSIRLGGAEVVGAGEPALRALRGRVAAMVFQEPLSALNPLIRIGEAIAEPLRLRRGLTARAARDRAVALLGEVGLPDPAAKARQYPHELSGGQRQRALIALALAQDPQLLIADEPTTALDAAVAARILGLLAELSARRGMALVLISHDLGAIARVTGRLLVMYGGDVVEDGPTAAVLADPRHPYTRGLIAARPRLDAARPPGTPLPAIPGAVPPLPALSAGCRFADRCALARPGCAVPPPPVAVAPGRVAACWAVAP